MLMYAHNIHPALASICHHQHRNAGPAPHPWQHPRACGRAARAAVAVSAVCGAALERAVVAAAGRRVCAQRARWQPHRRERLRAPLARAGGRQQPGYGGNGRAAAAAHARQPSGQRSGRCRRRRHGRGWQARRLAAGAAAIGRRQP
eukprot:363862-Chlamydomonas_euryale.AAC.20